MTLLDLLSTDAVLSSSETSANYYLSLLQVKRGPPISDTKHRGHEWLHIHETISVTHLAFEPNLKVSQVKVSPPNNLLVT